MANKTKIRKLKTFVIKVSTSRSVSMSGLKLPSFNAKTGYHRIYKVFLATNNVSVYLKGLSGCKNSSFSCLDCLSSCLDDLSDCLAD